jgi:ABC-type glycerol-3-phosphate transport system permease component
VSFTTPQNDRSCRRSHIVRDGSGRAAPQRGPAFAEVSMAALPTLVLYLFLNKRVIRGLTAGGVKG